jgi:sialate O-acetylesterase
MRKLHTIVFSMLLFWNFSLQAKIIVAGIFSNNMVLQRNAKIPIWGWAAANERVTVQFHLQTKSVITDQNGKWMLRLDKENAGGPYVLKVIGSTVIVIKNVLVGDVWICSGQSNMEWTVGQSDNAKIEIAAANYPNIRHIKIPKEINSIPNTDIKNSNWNVCSPATVADFTGVGYFYAKNLYDKLHIPIGLINASWGGTNIETWISREGFESSAEFKEMISSMPKIDLDSLLNLKKITEVQRVEAIQKAKLNSEALVAFKEQSLDDTSWATLQQPGIWEDQSLGDFDGVVWLRKHFTLTTINNYLMLEIPAIDDDDSTFVNGVKIGATTGWDVKRNYRIPSQILKIGDNVIAIRVVDNGGGGGIYGNASDLKLVEDTTSIPLNGGWKFQIESIKSGVNENEFPSLCFNAMIHPLIPFAFQGVLWYQGEANTKRAYQYRKAFPLLINDWRSQFQQGNFPFYFVQLATFKTTGSSNEGCPWAELREAQSKTLQMANTGMVVTTDIGNSTSIHPTNKQEVGKRLAAIAFANLVHEKKICSGPSFRSFEVKGNLVTITFDNTGSGLMTYDISGAVKGFEIAGEDQVFYPAQAKIKENKVQLSCDKIAKPVAVRFGWIGDASACNVFNQEGFPAVPFRTDDWKMISKEEQYSIKKVK